MGEETFFRPSRRKRQAEQQFIPLFFDELNITDEAETACEGNPQCILDLLITEDMDLAMETLNLDKETNETKETISMHKMCVATRNF